MTIWNLGSINADHVYDLPHIPGAGETLAARGLTTGLGGKGANMSVACARAGAPCVHLGAVGADGAWAIERLWKYGVDTSCITTLPGPTGHAIIALAEGGENMIITHPGTNHQVPMSLVEAALALARPGDWFLTQNETNLQAEGMAMARARGLKTAYAAAPFDAAAVTAVLDQTDFLILNAVEAAQLQQATGLAPGALPVADVIVTRGAEGADWFDHRTGTVHHIAALRVTPVDTTAAGDCFTGYVLAGLDRGMGMAEALHLAARAAALKVTRPGAADAIPTLAETEAFHP
jgi:ribokinase